MEKGLAGKQTDSENVDLSSESVCLGLEDTMAR